MELAYSGLHQLCAPMLDRLHLLPGPQRDALATVFGRSTGPPVLVAAVRSGAGDDVLQGVPELRVRGLDEANAREEGAFTRRRQLSLNRPPAA
jgi:hypothetical protein